MGALAGEEIKGQYGVSKVSEPHEGLLRELCIATVADIQAPDHSYSSCRTANLGQSHAGMMRSLCEEVQLRRDRMAPGEVWGGKGPVLGITSDDIPLLEC